VLESEPSFANSSWSSSSDRFSLDIISVKSKMVINHVRLLNSKESNIVQGFAD
jgi:hypothetical protein